MKYCPYCGNELIKDYVDHVNVMRCTHCDFIDWNTWVNVACCVIAVNEQNQVLLVKLKDTGKLTFPGGYRNLGETLEEAAKREFMEETGGMQVSNLELFRIYTKDEQRLIWVIYKGKVESGTFNENDETDEMIYVDKYTEIDETLFRGKLTQQLFKEFFSK
ncbi:NUDIX domain-containing protein [Acholeplasma equirhinis]|uniref:NUDIX hydrolase n=1 Tax=Acholeplasma equirhinis TaxID=555393 RepID=UPI00197ABE48|nr:NUDIX domain-containing protein [Acholeplasma equirhinis]MBN3490147.1 NUDIX domain-containing protein [Acholeplasma equirhinis]